MCHVWDVPQLFAVFKKESLYRSIGMHANFDDYRQKNNGRVEDMRFPSEREVLA